MADNFADALEQRIQAGMAPAVVGLDPRLDRLPTACAPDAPAPERIVAFYSEVLPVLARHVPVVKPNIAFFEQHGWEGFRAYQTTCRQAQNAGLLVIGDVKRGDIGSTAAAYADSHFRWADAITLHPYLGSDSIEPFLRHCRETGKGVFILVRTSNPSAAEFQALKVADGRDVSDAVADAVHRWGEGTGQTDGYGTVGAVVGATYGGDIARLRERMPRAWILLPGVGAQGARVADVQAAFDDRGRGALVAQSRGVMHAFEPDDADWRDKIEAAAAAFAAEVHSIATATT
jgi:orotidine-5'-phosphate decarboxylase